MALARLEAPLEVAPYFRGVVLEEQAELPLSEAGAQSRKEAWLLLLAARKAVFEGKEAQLPLAEGAQSQEAALEEQTKARLPVFEAEAHSPHGAPAAGRTGNSLPLQAEQRSRTNASEEEATARVPVPAADLKALA